MRFDDDPDVRGWQVDPGRAPGMSKGKLALLVGAGVIVLGGYLLLPLDAVVSAVFGAWGSTTSKPVPVAGATLDMRDLNSLASHHVAKPPPRPSAAEAAPNPPAGDDSALKIVQQVVNKVVPGQTRAPDAPKTKKVDPDTQKRMEEAKRKREAMLKSKPIFLTRPTEEKVGQLHALKSPFSLAPSEEIPCETTMEISSETPGAFVAVVSRDVPDTATRTRNVIPKGSKFVLKPRGNTIFGDSRMDIQAQTLTFPSGPWLKLPASTVTDQYGTAGFTGNIDRHLLRNYGAVILTSVLRGGTTVVAGGYGGSPAERVTGAVAQDTASEATRDMRQFINTKPTIGVPALYACRLLLEDELVLPRGYPWTP